jgi:hypothetical protein
MAIGYTQCIPTIRLIGRVDEKHRLVAEVPASISAGPVELTIVIPAADEDDAGAAWAQGVQREWAEELADQREDLYTLDDGEPVDGSR